MLKVVKDVIERHNMLQAGDRVLVACSGGPDSLALLHLFWRLQSLLSIEVAAAHLEHGFRGAESKAEALFVADFCCTRKIPCFCESVDMPELLRQQGQSAQDGARQVRYAFLRRVAQQWGAARIATGHQLEDQGETLLLHLLRGAGPKGLAAMREVAGDLIRPLLGIKREAIEAYCSEHGLVPQRDSSNEKTCYQRNWLRLELMPVLRRYNNALPETLHRTARLLGEQQDYLRAQAQEALAEVAIWKEGTLHLAAKELGEKHLALQREIFRLAIEKKRGQLTGISFDHVESLIEVLSLPVGSRRELPGDLQARRTYQGICLEAKGQEAKLRSPWPGTVLAVPGRSEVPALGLVVLAEEGCFTDAEQSDSIVLARAQVKGDLVLRTRLPGDRFQPLGMTGSKKLKDFLIDEKVPRELRDDIPLVCDALGILWLVGLRRANRACAKEKEDECIRLTIYRKQEEPTCTMM